VNRNRNLLFNERAVCVFAATAFEKEAWYIALRRATSQHSLVAEAALGGAYASFLRSADVALASAVGGGDPSSVPHWLACLNLAAARYFFDLQRNARFATTAAGRIQEQLDRLDLPSCVAPLKVTRLQLPAGGAPPRAHHLILCGPEAHPALSDVTLSRGPIPVFQAEMTYTGGLAVDIETRIDVTALALQIGWDLTGAGSSGDGASTGETGPDGDSSGGSKADLTLPQRLLATPAGAKLQETASRWGQKLSSTPLRLSLSLQELSGTLRLWFAPPPGDRLWFCFTSPPVFRMRAVPAFGDRGIAHPKLAAWVSDRIVDHLRGEIFAACVFPNTGDIPLSGLIHPDIPEMDIPTARNLDTAPPQTRPSASAQQQPPSVSEPERTMHALADALQAAHSLPVGMERLVAGGGDGHEEGSTSDAVHRPHEPEAPLSPPPPPPRLSADESDEPVVWPPPQHVAEPQRAPPPAWLQLSPPDSPRSDNPFAEREPAATAAAASAEAVQPAVAAPTVMPVVEEHPGGALDPDAMLAVLKLPPAAVPRAECIEPPVVTSPPSFPVPVPPSASTMQHDSSDQPALATSSTRAKEVGSPGTGGNGPKWMDNLRGAAVRAVAEAAPKVQRALAQTEEKIRQAHAQALAAQHAAAQRRLSEQAAARTLKGPPPSGTE
jgi:hypothetical protein